MSAKTEVGPSKTGVGPSKSASDPSKSGVGPSKTGSWTPKILTTGRWICRKCLNYVPPEGRVCRCCGGEGFTMEWDANALSEVFQRDAERIKTRMERRV